MYELEVFHLPDKATTAERRKILGTLGKIFFSFKLQIKNTNPKSTHIYDDIFNRIETLHIYVFVMAIEFYKIEAYYFPPPFHSAVFCIFRRPQQYGNLMKIYRRIEVELNPPPPVDGLRSEELDCCKLGYI